MLKFKKFVNRFNLIILNVLLQIEREKCEKNRYCEIGNFDIDVMKHCEIFK